MKKLLLLSIALILSCGSTKQKTTTKKTSKKTTVLPPDVNSNKYSKKRTRTNF